MFISDKENISKHKEHEQCLLKVQHTRGKPKSGGDDNCQATKSLLAKYHMNCETMESLQIHCTGTNSNWRLEASNAASKKMHVVWISITKENIILCTHQ